MKNLFKATDLANSISEGLSLKADTFGSLSRFADPIKDLTKPTILEQLSQSSNIFESVGDKFMNNNLFLS